MNENHVVDLLNDYVDGDLSEHDRLTVEAHLAGCAACRRELQELQSLLGKLRQLPRQLTPPAEVARGIREEFEERRTGDRGRPAVGGGESPARRRRSAWIFRAAAAVAVVTASGIVWYFTSRPAPERFADESHVKAPADTTAAPLTLSVPQPPAAVQDSTQRPRRAGRKPVPQPELKLPSGDIATLRTQHTEGRITGRVVDELTQWPIPQAIVQVDSLGRRATTDAYGQFVVLGVPLGTHTVSVTAVGYQPRSVSDVLVRVDSTSSFEVGMVTSMAAAGGAVAGARKSAPAAAPFQQRGTMTPVGAISGTVVGANDSLPLMGVTVLVEGTARGASTDSYGKYTIMNVPAGTYDLRFTAIGYESKTVTGIRIIAGGNIVVNAALTVSDVQMKAVVVGAEQVIVNSQQAPSSAMASERKIEAIPNVKGVEDALKLQPGDVKQGGSLFLRGGRADEVVYTVDGVPMTRTQYTRLEGYDRIYESPFLDAATNPLSTFSIDVDAASYSNVRRFLNGGHLPPKDAVRIEELVNYFTYDYPQPTQGNPFSITLEAAGCPWKSDHRLVLVGLQGKKIPTENLPPSNLVFLIDVSGSMNEPSKLPLVKAAFRLLVDQLRREDRVSIVVYAGAAGLVLPPTRGDSKREILAAIDELRAGGSTAGGAGIQLAYSVAKENFIDGGNNRVILATDGDFNVGVSSDAELVRMIEEKRRDGIFLSVLGFGTGNYQDAKMQQLADKGNGNHFYIDTFQEARRVFVSQMTGTLLTIAKDVKIQVEFNPATVKAYRLIGYENRLLAKEDFNNDRKDAGELGAGVSVTALYEIVPASGKIDLPSVDSLKYQRTELTAGSGETMTVKFRYKAPDDTTSRLITQTLGSRLRSFDDASTNLRFAAAVAGFGMLLRGSEFKGDASYEDILRIAKGAQGEDAGGYRAEFLRLVEVASGFAH